MSSEKKITLTTDQARERVDKWVNHRFESNRYSLDVRNNMIEILLRHFYGI